MGVLVGVFLSFFGERGKRKAGEGFFFPCLMRPGEEEDPQCRSKRHRLGLFFFKTVDEMAPPYLKCVVSFKKKGAKNVLESKSVLNL